ncbi:hypothetical protein PMIN06_008435 [Paraphaeosphaeria minitans]
MTVNSAMPHCSPSCSLFTHNFTHVHSHLHSYSLTHTPTAKNGSLLLNTRHGGYGTYLDCGEGPAVLDMSQPAPLRTPRIRRSPPELRDSEEVLQDYVNQKKPSRTT